MLIDHVKLKYQSGIGWIVLLQLLLVTSWFSFVLTLVRRPRLCRVPYVLLFNRITLGSSLVWGSVFLIFGVLFGTVYFLLDEINSEDRTTFYCIFLPIALTGFFQLVYWSTYRQVKIAADRILEQIAVNPVVKIDTIRVDKTVFKANQVRELFEDLRANGVISFRETSDGVFHAEILHAEIRKALHLTASAPAKTVAEAVYKTWVCPGCGATNTTTTCEYCGNKSPN